MAKPPTKPRRVMADSLEVVVDGVTYQPHEGEWVEFKGRPTIGLYLALAQLGESAEGLSRLLAQIHDWNLTDDDGACYPRPPTLEALMALPKEELTWLVANASADGSVNGDDLKN